MITHLLLVVLAVGIVVSLYRVWGDYGYLDAVEVIVPVCLLSLAGWLGYRFVAALVVARVASESNEWGTRALCGVVPYEVVWLWSFLLIDGGLALAEGVWPEWWVFSAALFGLEGSAAESAFVWFVFLCNLGLVLAWWWRYRIAWRAVRYANF
jgi:hypothetical protein